MKLKQYLEDYGIRTGWFADKIPCTATYLCCIVRDKSVPSTIIKNRIKELTGGLVTEKDFAKPKPRTKKKKSVGVKSKID